MRQDYSRADRNRIRLGREPRCRRGRYVEPMTTRVFDRLAQKVGRAVMRAANRPGAWLSMWSTPVDAPRWKP